MENSGAPVEEDPPGTFASGGALPLKIVFNPDQLPMKLNLIIPGENYG